jgi:hypothetical protein
MPALDGINSHVGIPTFLLRFRGMKPNARPSNHTSPVRAAWCRSHFRQYLRHAISIHARCSEVVYRGEVYC